MSTKNEAMPKESGLIRFAKKVEFIGNKIPHPFYLFLILLTVTMVASAILAACGVEVTYMTADKAGAVTEQTIVIKNLLSKENLQSFFTSLISIYQSNTVLIPTLVIAMAMSVTDKTGMFEVLMKKVLSVVPASLVVYVFAVFACCGNAASEAGQILVAMVGAVLFKALGRNPWLGIALGWAGGAGAFTVNLVPVNTDVLLSTITQSLADGMGYSEVHVLSNYFFLAVSTLLVAGAFTLVTELYTKKVYGDSLEKRSIAEAKKEFAITEEESKGLRRAGIGVLIVIAVVLVGAIPTNGFFRAADGTLVPKSPLMSSIVQIICALFLTSGLCFGFGSGKIKSWKEVPGILKDGNVMICTTMLVLVPAQWFIYQFQDSGIATLIAVGGERLLRSINLTGYPMLAVFACIVFFLNLFMTSGSVKWMLLSPIFVPMLANLGTHPAVIQLAYRIGDSSTNNWAPVQPVLVIILTLMQQYRDPRFNKEEPGIGTLMAGQIPYSIVFMIVMLIQLGVWYIFNLPIGPGITIR